MTQCQCNPYCACPENGVCPGCLPGFEAVRLPTAAPASTVLTNCKQSNLECLPAGSSIQVLNEKNEVVSVARAISTVYVMPMILA